MRNVTTKALALLLLAAIAVSNTGCVYGLIAFPDSPPSQLLRGAIRSCLEDEQGRIPGEGERPFFRLPRDRNRDDEGR